MGATKREREGGRRERGEEGGGGREEGGERERRRVGEGERGGRREGEGGKREVGGSKSPSGKDHQSHIHSCTKVVNYWRGLMCHACHCH